MKKALLAVAVILVFAVALVAIPASADRVEVRVIVFTTHPDYNVYYSPNEIQYQYPLLRLITKSYRTDLWLNMSGIRGDGSQFRAVVKMPLTEEGERYVFDETGAPLRVREVDYWYTANGKQISPVMHQYFGPGTSTMHTFIFASQ